MSAARSNRQSLSSYPKSVWEGSFDQPADGHPVSPSKTIVTGRGALHVEPGFVGHAGPAPRGPPKAANLPMATEGTPPGVTKLATGETTEIPKTPNKVLSGGESGSGPPIVCKKELSQRSRGRLDPCAPAPSILPNAKEVTTGDVARSSRYERRDQNRRHALAREAVEFAYEMDWPLNVFLTITWHALLEASERAEGHCLWRPSEARETYIRKELARRCRTLDLPFVAIWARDVGRIHGEHFHIFLFWPSPHLEKLVQLVERVSGSLRALKYTGKSHGVVAVSECGGWMLQKNFRPDENAGARDLARYIAGQQEKHPRILITGKHFGFSESIGPKARQRNR